MLHAGYSSDPRGGKVKERRPRHDYLESSGKTGSPMLPRLRSSFPTPDSKSHCTSEHNLLLISLILWSRLSKVDLYRLIEFSYHA